MWVQLKAYFQLQKKDEDGAAPNTKETLVTKCLAMVGRVTSEYKKDENNNEDNNDSNEKDIKNANNTEDENDDDIK